MMNLLTLTLARIVLLAGVSIIPTAIVISIVSWLRGENTSINPRDLDRQPGDW